MPSEHGDGPASGERLAAVALAGEDEEARVAGWGIFGRVWVNGGWRVNLSHGEERFKSPGPEGIHSHSGVAIVWGTILLKNTIHGQQCESRNR